MLKGYDFAVQSIYRKSLKAVFAPHGDKRDIIPDSAVLLRWLILLIIFSTMQGNRKQYNTYLSRMIKKARYAK